MDKLSVDEYWELFKKSKKLEEYITGLKDERKSLNPDSVVVAIQELMKTENPWSSPDFLKLVDISNKLISVNNLIQFCETILRKMKSNEDLDSKEQTFLKYMSMVSQILEINARLKTIETMLNSRVEDYGKSRAVLTNQTTKCYDAFRNFMTLSSCTWPSVPDGKGGRKSSGGAQKEYRQRTEADWFEIEDKGEKMRMEKKRSLDNFEHISSQRLMFLKRRSDLFSFCSCIIRMFELESFPGISFFLSNFDPNHFNMFQYKIKILDKKFQLFKTETDTFILDVDSEKHTCLRNCELIYPSVHRTNWKNAHRNLCTFFGKQD